MVAIIEAVTKAFKMLHLIMMTNPILIIVSLIVGLVAAFVYLWNTSERFRNFWIDLWQKIKFGFEVIWNTMSNFFTEKIPEAFQNLRDKLAEIGNNIKTFFENLWNSIVSFFTETIPNVFKDLLDKIVKIGNDIKTFFENLWKGIVSFFIDTIPKWIDNVIKWFSNLPYKLGYLIGQVLGHIVKFGMDAYNWVATELPKIIQSIIDWFAQLPRKNFGMVSKHI